MPTDGSQAAMLSSVSVASAPSPGPTTIRKTVEVIGLADGARIGQLLERGGRD